MLHTVIANCLNNTANRYKGALSQSTIPRTAQVDRGSPKPHPYRDVGWIGSVFALLSTDISLAFDLFRSLGGQNITHVFLEVEDSPFLRSSSTRGFQNATPGVAPKASGVSLGKPWPHRSSSRLPHRAAAFTRLLGPAACLVGPSYPTSIVA